jgi:hypothetical protein
MAKASKETAKKLSVPGFVLEPGAFGQTGEVLAGLNILKLEIGQVGGPFILKKILPNQDLGGGKGKNKRKPVDVYVAEHNKLEIRMPVSASFVGKAKDAKLAPGDTFLVRRDPDYTSKEYGSRECKSYSINITARAGKK